MLDKILKRKISLIPHFDRMHGGGLPELLKLQTTQIKKWRAMFQETSGGQQVA
jgi:hypothetical protein